MAIIWKTWCPAKWSDCPYTTRMLKQKGSSEQAARDIILNHLQCSTHHKGMTQREMTELLENAQFETFTDDQPQASDLRLTPLSELSDSSNRVHRHRRSRSRRSRTRSRSRHSSSNRKRKAEDVQDMFELGKKFIMMRFTAIQVWDLGILCFRRLAQEARITEAR